MKAEWMVAMADKKILKQDLRVSRTQKALVGALFSLLEKTPFGKVTVNDICEAAMVSRATFYTHFEDKYHLLRFGLEQVRGKLAEETGGDRRTLITKLLDHMSRHSKMFRNLFGEDSNQELRRMLSSLFISNFASELERRELKDRDLPVPATLLAVFMAGGIASILLWWVSGETNLTKEEMVEHLCIMGDLKKQMQCS